MFTMPASPLHTFSDPMTQMLPKTQNQGQVQTERGLEALQEHHSCLGGDGPHCWRHQCPGHVPPHVRRLIGQEVMDKGICE